jgi:polysaccharide deacetylase family protein (PEP-CTERM system associated)
MKSKSPLKNSMTVDVEDYYQVSAFNEVVKYSEWEYYESRVERNTNKILNIFDEHKIQATFFILGWVAEKHPNIVKEIQKRGHEIACHGYSHQLIYNQSRKVFEEEAKRAKSLLEDITGVQVSGYRAASYSITNKSLWALDVLAEAGFKYDSSIFPIVHDRYGIPNSPKEPYKIITKSGNEILEFPLSTFKIIGLTLPVSGGGYFRLYPYNFTRYALQNINKMNKLFVFYLHPWEIDPGQPKIKASALSRYRHYNNLHKCEQRLRQLVEDFKFTTMNNIIDELNLYESATIPYIKYNS